MKYKGLTQETNKYSIGITIVRICICFIIFKNMCFYIPSAEIYFGSNGIFPYENYVDLMKVYNISFLTYPFNLNYAPRVFLMITGFLSVMYMFAIGGRISGILLYFCIIILKIRNGFILDGSDNVIQVVLPFIILSDNLNYFRLYEKNKENLFSVFLKKYSTIFSYALMIQVCFVYFFTALAKHEGELWRNGTAVYYTMRVRDFMATEWNIYLTQNHYFVVLSTYFTLFWEMSFPFLIWFKSTKKIIIICGVLLHFGIWLFMRIDNFSWVMISTYFSFITNDEYRGFHKSLLVKKNKLIEILK